MVETIRFDPRSLISKPFITCPKCGQLEFGILIITGNTYTRRCRSCSHKQDYWLPPVCKKIIYLDQNVISNLMKLVTPAARGHERVKSDPFWQQLYDLLVQLRHLQLIVCPSSDSHENESLAFEFGDALRSMYQNLGSGNSFERFDQIKALQLGELGRAWVESREPRFRFNPRSVLARDPNEWNERFYITVGLNPFVSANDLRQARAETHAYITNLFKTVWAAEKHPFVYWYDLERHGYQGMLRRAVIQSRQGRLQALTEFRPGEPIPLHNLNAVLSSFAENMVHSLRWIFRFPKDGTELSADEILELEKSFGNANRIAEAPFVKLSALMYASIAMKAASGQREPPNQGTTTDIETVSHLLPYCDAMFVDNGCRALLLDVPKTLRPTDTNKIFSFNVRGKFLEYLRSLRDEISKEQLDAVKRVYGERYTEGILGADRATADIAPAPSCYEEHDDDE
jgi:hypothetical protein